jgi:hypothetical protein
MCGGGVVGGVEQSCNEQILEGVGERGIRERERERERVNEERHGDRERQNTKEHKRFDGNGISRASCCR